MHDGTNTLRRMSDWHDYQRQVARFFASIGCSVTVDAVVDGVRTKHRIDVLALSSNFGVVSRWVVECKNWNRRVSKGHVLVLQGVVDDVGADKGFLVSEAGFQPGALAASQQSNIVLTDLRELGSRAQDELANARLESLDRRARVLKGHMLSIAFFWKQYVSEPGEDDGGLGYFFRLQTTVQLSVEMALFRSLPYRALYANGGVFELKSEEDVVRFAEAALPGVEQFVSEIERMMEAFLQRERADPGFTLRGKFKLAGSSLVAKSDLPDVGISVSWPDP